MLLFFSKSLNVVIFGLMWSDTFLIAGNAMEFSMVTTNRTKPATVFNNSKSAFKIKMISFLTISIVAGCNANLLWFCTYYLTRERTKLAKQFSKETLRSL